MYTDDWKNQFVLELHIKATMQITKSSCSPSCHRHTSPFKCYIRTCVGHTGSRETSSFLEQQLRCSRSGFSVFLCLAWRRIHQVFESQFLQRFFRHQLTGKQNGNPYQKYYFWFKGDIWNKNDRFKNEEFTIICFLLVHPTLQVLFGLQPAHGVVEAVVSQAFHKLLLEGFALSWNNKNHIQ